MSDRMMTTDSRARRAAFSLLRYSGKGAGWGFGAEDMANDK